MARALGILSFEHDLVKIEGVSKHRPLISASFLGRYRLMDFVISNFTNSKMENLHIYVKEKPRSVFEHVGTGRHYNINSKYGKLRVMYGEREISSAIYNTDIQSFLQNEAYILEDNSEYVIVTVGHFVYLQNYRKVLDKHIESGADVTILTKKTQEAKEYFHGCMTVAVDKEKRITKFGVNRGQAKTREICLEAYVMRKELFINLCHQANQMSSIYWFKDILVEKVDELVMKTYPVSRTVFAITDLKSYYDANMQMLEKESSDLFDVDWPIYTKTSDSVPAQYGPKAEVSNSLVANGCVINGKVSHCVIGRGVVIGEGSVVKDCLILPSCVIGKDKNLQGLVIDKHVHIEKQKEILGSKDEIIYLNRYDKL